MASQNGRWSARDDTILLTMRREGKTWDEIAVALGRKKATVQWYAWRHHGLLPPKKFRALKAELRPVQGSGPRPTLRRFLEAALRGGDNRGWGSFLEEA